MMPQESSEPSRAAAVMTQAMNWAYEHATTGIPGIGSSSDLAESHLRKCGGSPEKAIDDLIAWQVGYAGAAGFLTNIGGAITMPVSVPANLASVFLIQLRMITAIAHLNGYKIDDEHVRTVVFICLTGSMAAKEFGIELGTKLATKAGSKGLINLTKVVPFVGGLIGGAFDATTTRAIGEVAKKAFKPLGNDPL